MKKCIIIANGNAPTKSEVLFFYNRGYDTIFCADGGSNSAYKLNLIPEYIVGDFDSINPEVLDFYKGKSKIINIKRQNDTDVEKCLKTAIKKGFGEVVLLGGTGDRLDHSFCNLGIVLKFFDQIKIRIVHHNSILDGYRGSILIKTKIGETISLYGFDRKTKITSKGLKYPLKNTSLPFGEKESTSNSAIAENVSLNVRGGKIFVVRDLKVLKENGLI